jgi:hypothetical protein
MALTFIDAYAVSAPASLRQFRQKRLTTPNQPILLYAEIRIACARSLIDALKLTP